MLAEYHAPPGRYLAVVEFLSTTPPNRFARARPLYQINDDYWQPIQAGDSRFADEGLVYWWQPPSHALQNTLWVVSLESQHKYGQGPRYRDRCQVSKFFSPYQATALHGVRGPRAFRRVLSSGRLSFSMPLMARPLVLVIDDEAGHWIALPDGLLPSMKEGLTCLNLTGSTGPMTKYAIDAEAFTKIQIGDQRISLLLDLGKPCGYLCAATDAQLLEHLRKRISKFDRGALEAIEVSKQLLSRYAVAIEKAGFGDDDAKEEAWREAAELLVEGLDTEGAALASTVDALMAHPLVREAIAAREEQAIDVVRKRWEMAVAAEHQRTTETLRSLKEEIETNEVRLSGLRAGIDEAVGDILKRPITALARHGLLAALQSSLLGTARPLQAFACAPPPHEEVGGVKLAAIGEGEELIRAIASWNVSTGIDPYLLQVSLAAILAHQVSLISGALGERLALALAMTLAGDRSVRLPVGSAVFELSDLMCAPVVPLGATPIGRGQTLADFLSSTVGDDPAVVILAGCNRAPPEIALTEFLPTLGDGPLRLTWRCEGGSLALVTLGPNVRFLGTLAEGGATHPVPADLSARLPLIPADHRVMPRLPPMATRDKNAVPGLLKPPSPTRIDPGLWATLQATHPSDDTYDKAIWLAERGVALPIAVSARILALYQLLLGDQTVGMAEAMAALILGRGKALDPSAPPGIDGAQIRERLQVLAEAEAWQRASRHFDSGDEK